jgi:hypothetical protein
MVARRAVAARKPKAESPVTVVLRDVPPGYNWGWYSREDQRMHLQTVDREHKNQYKVWLEANDKRVFEPAGPIPAAILKKLKAEVARRRAPIDAEWVHFMIEHRWLKHEVHDRFVTLTAYPRMPTKIERTIDLADYLGPEWAAEVKPEDVFLNSEFSVIALFPKQPESRQPFIPIPEILWQD